MFTGLVAGIGVIRECSRQERGMRLAVATTFTAASIAPGDSVAVNGVCLTAENIVSLENKILFTAHVSAETLENSNLGNLKSGGTVNLELALCVGQRLGGHLVSGHVDGTAVVSAIERRSGSHFVRFFCTPQLDIYIVSRGSVCVDGVSLTVTDCGSGYFELNIIPETWKATTAHSWYKGYAANLEVDMLGKYVAKMLCISASGKGSGQNGESSLGLDFFINNGFN